MKQKKPHSAAFGQNFDNRLNRMSCLKFKQQVGCQIHNLSGLEEALK